MVHRYVASLFDSNALLEGLCDDSMINMYIWNGNDILLDWVWIGKHELYELLIIHDICVMGNSWLVGGTCLKYG